MKAARAAVKPRVIRPDFFSCVLIQRIELAGAGPDEEQLSTDRGLGEDSAAGFNLPENLSLKRIRLRKSQAGNRQHGEPQQLHFFPPSPCTSNFTTASIAPSTLFAGRL